MDRGPRDLGEAPPAPRHSFRAVSEQNCTQSPRGSPLWDRRMDLLRRGGGGSCLCEHRADSGPCLQFTRPLVVAEKNTLFRR